MKLQHDEPLSTFPFKSNLRRYKTVQDAVGRVKELEEEAWAVGGGRGLHSSTFRLIVSTFEGYAGWFHGVK
jgi:hypothetical protein